MVIHQQSRRLLKMDILITETCWAHNNWNKIASDIKLVFHSSTIAMMHGPINIRLTFKRFQLGPLILKQRDGQNNEKQHQLPKRRVSDIAPAMGRIQNNISTAPRRELYTSGIQFRSWKKHNKIESMLLYSAPWFSKRHCRLRFQGFARFSFR